MDRITILFGTESGNAEMVADDLSAAMGQGGIDAPVVSMEDYSVDDLRSQDVIILVVSTYGEGDLPETAVPFFQALREDKPDLAGLRFAAFGLGDSTYDTYNLGVATLVSALTDLGATQIGETGHHDADSGLDASELAVTWVNDVLALTAPA
ncbi:flavodoxin domain-containing protein [Pseudonocardia kujensis]|uniref:flavodoxin domain-containing protein n=1 Tax=Pseudonocardia kujensis TaxID=1128675 RepID=UPI001E619E4F|nr:flavodoxin domain-containing protein [Pseudonocardia kujensis]MCE0765012.1 flavodoxin domain-containing protein [Pseudonocardia kujensis]